MSLRRVTKEQAVQAQQDAEIVRNFYGSAQLASEALNISDSTIHRAIANSAKYPISTYTAKKLNSVAVELRKGARPTATFDHHTRTPFRSPANTLEQLALAKKLLIKAKDVLGGAAMSADPLAAHGINYMKDMLEQFVDRYLADK